MAKVFVGQLDWGITNEELEKLFGTHGTVSKASIITRGKRSLGYGFVDFEKQEDADKAVTALNKSLYKERTLKVELARPQNTSNQEYDGWQQNAENNNNINNNNNRNMINNRGNRRPPFRPRYYDNYNNNNDYNNNYYNNRPRYQNRYNNYNDYYRRRPVNRSYNNNNNNQIPNSNPVSVPVQNPQQQQQQISPPVLNQQQLNNNNINQNPVRPRFYQRRPYRQNFYGGGNRYYGGGPRGGRRYRQPARSDLSPNTNAPTSGNDAVQQNKAKRRSKKPSDAPQAPKILSKTAVFVANLPFSVTDEGLSKIFADHNVKNAHVVKTKNGRSRGYGFVDFETEEDQKRAIDTKNNLKVDDERSTAEKPREPRTITVNISHSVAPTPEQQVI